MDTETQNDRNTCAYCKDVWDRENSNGWGGIILNCAPFDPAGWLPVERESTACDMQKEFCSPICLLQHLQTDLGSKVHVEHLGTSHIVLEVPLEDMDIPDWMRNLLQAAQEYKSDPTGAKQEADMIVPEREHECEFCRKMSTKAIGVGTCYGSIWDALVTIYFCSTTCLVTAFWQDALACKKHNLGKWYASKS
jgi:hypothetical protein